ncbi:DUF4350 domain-containing protein [Lacinutrix salivirga]
MKKALPILLVLIAIIAIIAFSTKTNRDRTVDWEESFNEKSTKPYGLSIFYNELPKLFKDQKLRTVYHTPSSYFIAHSEEGYADHVAKGTFMIIGNSDYMYDASIDEILKFVENGNTFFISDYYFPEALVDTLTINTEYIENGVDSLSHLAFNYSRLKDKNITIDKSEGDNYFIDLEDSAATILGYAQNNEDYPNFIEIPFGKGYIYMHTEPKAFTNYHLLKEDRYTYTEGVLSYLPKEDIYFDSYSKIYSSYSGDVEQKSNLSWFLQQRAFKWAWYTALLLTFIFMIFNAKRRQRIIKVIKPLQNTTVAFVKTISNLYFETQDHKNLIDKKIVYFLEKIRTDFNMDTSVLDEQFIKRLVSKSGKKEDVVKPLINHINWLRTKNEFFEDNLIKLNRYIEAFYSK